MSPFEIEQWMKNLRKSTTKIGYGSVSAEQAFSSAKT